MKAGWQLKKLRDTCELVNGRAYGKTELLAEGKYRVLRVGNFFTSNHWYFSNLELEDKKYCDTGDLLYAWSASFGPRIWSGEKVIYHYHIWKVIPDPSVIDQRFLFHFFNWDTESIKADQGAGTTMLHVSKGSMEDRDIAVPPLTEQHRIVTLLDEAFDGIATAKANAEKNLQNARAIFESYLQSVFAESADCGEMVALAELATDITDGDHMPPPKALQGVPFITIGNIGKDTRTINFADTFMVSRAYFEGLKPIKKPKLGDVLYTVTGSYGVPVLINEEREFCFQRHIGLVRPRPGVSSEWLYYLLMSPQVFKQANDGATGTAQKTVSLKVLRGYRIPKIPLDMQLTRVAKLDFLFEETRRLETTYQRKLAALDELKKSLLHSAFNGEL
jgi:restriction endonuclease S subunit